MSPALIAHALKCPGIPRNILYYYVRIMGVVNFLRSFLEKFALKEEQPAPGHSTIYKGRGVFVCVSLQVVS